MQFGSTLQSKKAIGVGVGVFVGVGFPPSIGAVVGVGVGVKVGVGVCVSTIGPVPESNILTVIAGYDGEGPIDKTLLNG